LVGRHAKAPLVVNGRFLRAQPTGLHRVGRALLDALLEAGLDAEVVAPQGVTDSRVDRQVRTLSSGRGGDHAFEQIALPAIAGRRPVLSLTNTGPILARRGWLAVHDLGMIHRPDWYAGSMRIYARGVAMAARRAERVITFTQVVKSELVGIGVGAEKIVVVREAVDPSFRPAPPEQVAEVTASLGLAGSPYVLMLGWAHPRKDLATAVAAHRQVREQLPHRLVLVGEGHGTFAGVERPNDESILHVGHVEDAALIALLTGASALLYPSLYEGFGLPPLEAWACGTPALVADVPALRESSQGRGELLPPGDIDAWSQALLQALTGKLTAPRLPEWSWADAAQQLRGALPAEVWK
jgi:glycosyltransferase involved in cell wall biosynthesis